MRYERVWGRCLCVGLAVQVHNVSATGHEKVAQTKPGEPEAAEAVSPAVGLFLATKTKAAAGNREAQNQLGWLYEQGVGAPQDEENALRWYVRAAEQGLPVAQYNVGYYYSTRPSAPRDFAESLTWYGKAIDQLYPEATFERGWLSARGRGVPNSFAEATNWWWRAASVGYGIAQEELGLQFTFSTNWGRVGAQTVLLTNTTPRGKAAFETFRRAERELGFERISFTDTNGSVFQNAAVLMRDPAALYVRSADGRTYGRVRLADLPRDLQDRFGYEAAKAAACEAEQKARTDEAGRRVAAEREASHYYGTFLGRFVGAAKRAEAPNSEAANRITVLSGLVAEYTNSHTYMSGDLFECVDMACDVWNMVMTKGIRALIVVGRTDEDIKDVDQANHAWVLAEVLSGVYLALEPQGGVVYESDNPRYYFGHAFTEPSRVKAHNPLIKEIQRAQEKYRQAVDDYNSLVSQYNSASGDERARLELRLAEARGRMQQAEYDLREAKQRRLALFSR